MLFKLTEINKDFSGFAHTHSQTLQNKASAIAARDVDINNTEITCWWYV